MDVNRTRLSEFSVETESENYSGALQVPLSQELMRA